MKTKLFYIAALFSLFISCRKSTDYKEKLTGIWQLNNVPEVLKNSGDDIAYNAEVLRNATIAFESNGSLVTNISKLQQKGSWSVSDDGTILKMKAEGLKFDESLPLEFENERTIIIRNNSKKLVFKKLKD